MVSRTDIQNARKQLGLDRLPAVLGDGSGQPRTSDGLYYVRKIEAGGLSAAVKLPLAAGVSITVADGVPCLVGWDENRQQVIYPASAQTLKASGVNPQTVNPLDGVIQNPVKTSDFPPFLCLRHGDTVGSPLTVVVYVPPVVNADGTVVLPNALSADLTSHVPAADLRCFAVVFWLDTNVLEVQSSTPVSMLDPLTNLDLEECIAASTAGSIPVWAWILQDAQSELSADPAKNMDFRQFINTASAGGGGGSFNDFEVAADSGTPQTIADGNTLTIAGGTGIDTVASATDTVTVNLDNTAVTPGSYTNADITVDAQGRLTAAANGGAGSSPWTTDSNVVNLNTDGDTVTIGSNTAGGKLFIDGDADEIQLQIQANATQTAMPFVLESSAGADQITFTGTGGAVFNEAGNDSDFRVEGTGTTTLLFTDASTNRVGINTSSPARSLEVVGDMRINSGGGGAPAEIYLYDVAATSILRAPPSLSGTRTLTLPSLAASASEVLVSESFAQTLSNKTLNSPIISDFTNAQHDHLDADDGGTLDAAAIASGTIALARLPALTARQFSQTDVVTVNSTAAETTILGTGVGTLTLAANQLQVGSVIRFTVSGYGQRSSGNVTVRVKLGGSTIAATATAAPSFTANGMFRLNAEITVNTIGATGTVTGQGISTFYNTNVLAPQMGMISTSPTVIDTTGTLAVDATIQWSTGALGNTVTTTTALIEICG